MMAEVGAVDRCIKANNDIPSLHPIPIACQDLADDAGDWRPSGMADVDAVTGA